MKFVRQHNYFIKTNFGHVNCLSSDGTYLTLCFACRWWGLGCLDLNNVWPVVNGGCSGLILLFSRYGYWHNFFRYCSMIWKQKKWLKCIREKNELNLMGKSIFQAMQRQLGPHLAFQFQHLPGFLTFQPFPYKRQVIVSRFLKSRKGAYYLT